MAHGPKPRSSSSLAAATRSATFRVTVLSAKLPPLSPIPVKSKRITP